MKLETAIEILKIIKENNEYLLKYPPPLSGQGHEPYHKENIKAITTILNHIDPPKAKVDKKHGFAEFWNLYPKKVDKVNAQKKWASMGLYKPEKSAGLFANLTKQLNSKDERFQREKNWIMGPAAYLFGRCWEDEIIQKKEHKKEWLTDAQVDSMARSGESYVDLFARLSAQGYNFNKNRS